jgi:hypothetical protein
VADKLSKDVTFVKSLITNKSNVFEDLDIKNYKITLFSETIPNLLPRPFSITPY